MGFNLGFKGLKFFSSGDNDMEEKPMTVHFSFKSIKIFKPIVF